ncbi:hypothetical protein FZI91_09300 [Mycobacterium sp. CBMA271]|uniref:hypothetical protein n=1 Tax=unclassified Mycobacteroides TaxID=2618759 RepID=UPI0012DD44C8|nr:MULTISPECIES: hypothetical protein [unclassified Mycobacteroides]MUM15627.1 hypothetical protein [Mycobacteroides sp. CBMA 326]MUM17422.1 hypothetical protein [Mycobacteroides sp. CBMA 326]MUM21897.1 hypothetical protein [Mycobacteroides sp. CBMA 271]
MPGLRYAMAMAATGLLIAAPVGADRYGSESVAAVPQRQCTQPRTGSEVCVSPGDAELRSWPDPADLPTPPDVPERPGNL